MAMGQGELPNDPIPFPSICFLFFIIYLFIYLYRENLIFIQEGKIRCN